MTVTIAQYLLDQLLEGLSQLMFNFDNKVKVLQTFQIYIK
jgi:hypothetical protein